MAHQVGDAVPIGIRVDRAQNRRRRPRHRFDPAGLMTPRKFVRQAETSCFGFAERPDPLPRSLGRSRTKICAAALASPKAEWRPTMSTSSHAAMVSSE